MPGGTQKYGLPYLLNTEGLWTIGNVTKLLAERLEALIDNGTLKGAPGSPGAPGAPGGPNGPAAAIVGNTAQVANSGSLYFTFSGTVAEYDLRSSGGAQTWQYGVIPSRAGIYAVSIVCPWGTNNANGQRILKLIDDATGNTIAEDVRPGSAVEQISMLTVVMPLAAGQKLNSHVYQNSGANLTYGGTQQGGIKTRFSITWLGPSS